MADELGITQTDGLINNESESTDNVSGSNNSNTTNELDNEKP
jgi:hypothetical protein